MQEASNDPNQPHKVICLDGDSGKEYFELSPQKLKEYYLEFHDSMVHTFVDDIDIDAVMKTISMNYDWSMDPSPRVTGLCEVVHRRTKEENRHELLRKLLGSLVQRPENITLRRDVEKLLELDLKSADIEFTSDTSIDCKAKLIAQHTAWANLPRLARSTKTEFCVRLYKLRNCSIDNLIIEELYYPYNISFDSFVTRLQEMTAFQRPNGGYSLSEGPWQYRLSSTSRDDKEWHFLWDENSFLQMLDKIKSAYGPVSFCHDLLRNEIDKHVQEEIAGGTCDWIDEILDENGLPFFDGLYMDYLHASRREATAMGATDDFNT